MRGSGAAGLGCMRAVRALDERDADLLLARPLLRWARRAETIAYCRARGIEVRADALNEDEQFARVRVRRRLVPLMETFNPRVVAALARTSELLRADSEALDEQAAQLLAAACGRQEQLMATTEATTNEVDSIMTKGAATNC